MHRVGAGEVGDPRDTFGLVLATVGVLAAHGLHVVLEVHVERASDGGRVGGTGHHVERTARNLAANIGGDGGVRKVDVDPLLTFGCLVDQVFGAFGDLLGLGAGLDVS